MKRDKKFSRLFYKDEASLHQIVNGEKLKGLYQKSHGKFNELSIGQILCQNIINLYLFIIYKMVCTL